MLRLRRNAKQIKPPGGATFSREIFFYSPGESAGDVKRGRDAQYFSWLQQLFVKDCALNENYSGSSVLSV